VDLAGDLRSLLATDAVRRYSRRGEARPFDMLADGAIPGEGAACVVLKRLADAERDGDRIYAVVRGVGTAHANSVGPNAPATAVALERLIPLLRAQGYAFATVAALLAGSASSP
jgi:acyl transferase domain-containing protein